VSVMPQRRGEYIVLSVFVGSLEGLL
jgi:hypothetical protein